MARLLALVLCLLAWPVTAQDLLAGFDRTERKITQAALALSGDYDGLIDGDFGPRSRRALEAFLGRGTEPDRWFSTLLTRYATEWRVGQWDAAASANGIVHFVRPRADTDATKLSVESLAEGAPAARARHEQTARQHRGVGEAYVLRRDRLLVTASEMADGGRIYVRSDRTASGFDTLVIEADTGNRGRLQLIASSVSRAGPPPLDPFAAERIVARLDRREPGVRIAPDLAFVALLCGGADVVAVDETLGISLVRIEAGPGGVVPVAPPAAAGLGADAVVARAPAKIVAASSAVLSIGDPEVLAATSARPGEDVLRLAAPVPPGTPVLTETGMLAGLISRGVSFGDGFLAVSAGPAALAALVPSEVASLRVPGSPAVQVPCVPGQAP